MPEKDPKKVQLGNRIRELREEAGLSREQMAEAAAVSMRAVIQWELGEREPGWFNMAALSAALGVTCEAFTTPAEQRKPRGPGRPVKGAAGPPIPKAPPPPVTPKKPASKKPARPLRAKPKRS